MFNVGGARHRSLMWCTLLALSLLYTGVAEAQEMASEIDFSRYLSSEGIEDITALDLEALLENVVVSATKSGVKEDLAPAITTVINRDEIQRWGYTSVDEVLRHVAGVYVIDDHIIPNVSVRGISGGLRSESGLIKVMIDGQPIVFRSTSGNWLGPELIPLSAVQQIEVIRGPASALYGADAFLGVINVVTRPPEKMNGGEVSIAGRYTGQPGWAHEVTMGAEKGRWKLLASYHIESQDRSGLQLPDSSPAPRLSLFAPADRRAHGLEMASDVGFLKLTRSIGTNGAATISGYFSTIDRGAEFAHWAQLTHNVDRAGRSDGTDISLRQGMLAIDVKLPLTLTLDLRATGQLFAGAPTSRDRIEVGSDMYYVKRDFGFRGFQTEVETSWRPSPSLSVLSGIGFVLDHESLPAVLQVMKGSIAGMDPGSVRVISPSAGSTDLSNTGAHIQVLWDPLWWLSLTGGARYDYHNVYGGQPSARLGGVLTLQKHLHFKLLYGSAFKAPSPQLLYGSPLMPGDITGNLNLKPSYVHTVEGQLAWRPHNSLLLTTGLAYSYLLDQAEFAQLGVNLAARNVAQVESLSWESELRFDYQHKLTGYANLSVNRTARRTEEPGYLTRVGTYNNPAYPRVVANLGISTVAPLLPLRLSFEASYVSARASSTTNAIDAGGRYELPPYFLLGGAIRSIDLHLLPEKQTIIMVVIRNILNSRIGDPGFAGIDYPQLGFSTIAQLIQEW